MFGRAPEIDSSTEEERRQYIKESFHCINDCDMCGICAMYHNQDTELVYRDYILGRRSFLEITKEYR